MRIFIILALSIWLIGCSASNSRQISDFYDYQLASPQRESLTLSNLPDAVKQADVILVGEWHTHSAIHRFQADLLRTLIEQHHLIVLSMEQFSRDSQPYLNQYLQGDIGEQYLIEQSNAWPNYASDYRPLVELAKHHQRPIIAANAPKNMVRCIGKQGIEYLDRLPKEQRNWVAKEINLHDSPYKARFMASMHHGKPAQHEQQFAAQMTWDETMAESIVDYLAAHPHQQVLHIAGAFHIQQGLGTAAAIHQRNPNLSIAIITPTSQITEKSSDFQLLVLPMPIRYLQPAHQWQAIERLKNRNTDLSCD